MSSRGPTSISLSNNNIAFDVPRGAVVGILAARGGMPPYTWHVSNVRFSTALDPALGRVLIRTGRGKLKAGIDQTVIIRVTDKRGRSYER